MDATTVTLLMAVMAVLVVGVDVWLALDKRPGNTYSERLRAWGKAWPPVRLLLAFGMGLLMGHWFWSTTEYVNTCPGGVP